MHFDEFLKHFLGTEGKVEKRAASIIVQAIVLCAMRNMQIALIDTKAVHSLSSRGEVFFMVHHIHHHHKMGLCPTGSHSPYPGTDCWLICHLITGVTVEIS